VAKVIQTRPTPFLNEVHRDSWWYLFKHKHLELSICLTKGLEINRAQGFTTNSCNLFYQNPTSLYIQHYYSPNHIWNFDEIEIQVGRQSRARVLTKKGSHQVYNTIPKSKEWLTINCAMNAIEGLILRFYIFQGERIRDDCIKHYKFGICMAVQTKAWMTSFLFKEFLSFFKRSILGGSSPSNHHLLILNGHGSHVSLQAIKQVQQFGLDMITLLSHTSHVLQPLDVSCFRPL